MLLPDKVTRENILLKTIVSYIKPFAVYVYSLILICQQDLPKPNLRKLRRMYKAWQLYGQDKSLSQN